MKIGNQRLNKGKRSRINKKKRKKKMKKNQR